MFFPILFGVILLAAINFFGVAALNKAYESWQADRQAAPRTLLNVIKVQKMDEKKEYVGGADYFHTSTNRGRLIHVSPSSNSKIDAENLASGFFDIPTTCDGCMLYMFHLKNVSRRILSDVKIKYKVKGEVVDPKIRFVNSEQSFRFDLNCDKGLCLVKSSSVHPQEIVSFGVMVYPGDEITEVASEVEGSFSEINHASVFYGDTRVGNKEIFFIVDGKSYDTPAINPSSASVNYKLINGIWTRY